MSNARKVLVIIQPTKDEHIALQRAIITSEVGDAGSHVRLFIGVDGERTDMKAGNAALYRDGAWLDNLIAPLKQAGIAHSMELCWSTDWQGAVLNCAQRFQPDHIFMPDYREDKGTVFSSNQWSLLRNAVAPVTIVRPGRIDKRRKILAAVNFERLNNPEYTELNDRILKAGMNIAGHYGAEFHVINAYPDSDNFPDRDYIVRRYQLPTQNVHVREGNPADVIAGFANEIGADTVILGTKARSGAAAFLKGNTSEKVLSKVEQDVITFS